MNATSHPILEQYDFTRVQNMWMQLVIETISELIEGGKTCDCTDCVLDLACLALNRLPPKYWASGDYNAFTSPQEFLGHPENRQTAKLAVFQALAMVKENPHH